MKLPLSLLAILLASLVASTAATTVDADDFAKSLGGWKKKDNYIDYPLSGADYRTYKPEVSPTPDGGIYVSIRIDHRRGWLSNDDHATLDITVNAKGVIESAQSTIAIQGQSIASDVIVGTTQAGGQILTPERAVQIGTDLISNLTAKLLLQNIVEAGRVSFPSVLRHNYNRLFQSIRVAGTVVPTAVAIEGADVLPPASPPSAPDAAAVQSPAPPAAPPATPPAVPAAPTPPAPPAPTPGAPPSETPAKPGTVPLEIKNY
ncbi:MAG: hypothetical protein V4640_07405 [Verrucomicrobiota bacterium]